MTHPEPTEVLVLGGGPGGASAAAILAQAGVRVRLLEKDHFPRFHIGESLLPASVPLFERLGIHDQVRECSRAAYSSSTVCGRKALRTSGRLNAIRTVLPVLATW